MTVNDRLVWIDCEMTGLDIERDALIEIACLVTDAELNLLDEGVDVIIKPPAEAVASMLDEFVPDYLVERVESLMEARLVNGYYSRLALGPEDHFASKGGYLVRFDGAKGTKVLADGSWLVP